MSKATMNHAIIRTLTCSIIVCLLGGTSAAMAAPQDHSPALIRLLSAIDIVPTPDQLEEATGQVPEDELMAVALDASLVEYLRSRATSMLSMFPSARSALHLETIARSVAGLSIRWMAVYTRVRAFGDSAAVRFAEKTFSSPVTRLRHASARALRWVPGDEATKALQAQLDRESDSQLRKTIQRMLRLRR